MSTSVSGAAAVVGVVTAANRLGAVSIPALASSPRGIGEGKLWLLATSALLADRPLAPSFIGFVVVGLAALAVCGARVLWTTAAAGHVLSALGVYGLVGAVRLVDPAAFQSVLSLQDYGLSAVIAAWIGAIACVQWRRGTGFGRRIAIVAGCLGCAGIGILCRPDLTVLDSEHVVAFAIGVALARIDLGPAFARAADLVRLARRAAAVPLWLRQLRSS